MTPPTAEQLDHLIGHTANRALTPDEHALLRDRVQRLRAQLAGTGAAVRRAPSGTYHQQVTQQLRDAETELGQRRQQVAELTEQRDTARAAASERATLLEHARDLLEPWGGHGDAWPDIAPAIEALIQRAEQAEAERDGAYHERAHLTAWLATTHPAVITPATDTDEPGWQLLYLTVGGRQLSWHIHPRDAELYAHVEHVQSDDPRAQWDGHTTEQKYAAIREMTFGELRGRP
ncbi:hypothetical protein ACFC1T_14650 [Kitasatospora sp. NPDC056076]|uniref:hypothetical protein n=1 Tax=Kitasatospora sp. NPDC056076 TaxID=3345703 RepID=UPI0035E0FF3D